MKLAELLSGVDTLKVVGRTERDVGALSLDSRKVERGTLFFAVPGGRTDGNRFVREVAARGAAGIVSELDPPPAPYTFSCPWVQVADIHRAMASFAGVFYGDASAAMRLVGVTGTNGKTTVCYFLEAIFEKARWPAGVLGTVDYRFMGRPFAKALNTTPVALELHRHLAFLRDEGARVVVMEVSSHALVLERVRGIRFDVGVFTNLSRDHLDFHETREQYLAAKRKLFEGLGRSGGAKEGRCAVVNIDDPVSENILKAVDAPVERLTYGFRDGADLRAEIIEADLSGTRMRLLGEELDRELQLRLIGSFNVANALAAFGAAKALGIDEASAVAGLESLAAIPGRLERVTREGDLGVFVDYAHTEGALTTVLEELKLLSKRRIVTVFGCGGDRDRGKRGPMGVAACRHSDEVIITTDNPRSEDPELIAGDIEEGLREAGLKNYSVELDRAKAIGRAIEGAGEGDVILIAGKGHENYQILRNETREFDDREIARRALAGRV